MTTPKTAEIFNDLYIRGLKTEGSSPGSTVEFTNEYRKFLKNYINEHNIKSIVDVGCGDWQFSKHINWDGIDYIGIDISQSCIDSDIIKYSKPNIKFDCRDIIEEDIPNADLVIVKDVLQHLGNRDISTILEKLNKFKHVLITQDVVGYGTNTDIETGGYRPVDVRAEPFNRGNYEMIFNNFSSNSKATLAIHHNEKIDGFKFFSMLKNVNNGVDLKRYGPNQDGGYIVPDIKFNKIITIGVGGHIEFESDYSKENPDCKFELYDHTVLGLPEQLPNSTFHRKGLGNGDGFLNISDIIANTEEHTLLKIDCEGAEWDCGLDTVEFKNIDSIVIELHYLDSLHMNFYNVISNICEEFYCINTNPNNYGGAFIHGKSIFPRVLELTYIKKDLFHKLYNKQYKKAINYRNNPMGFNLTF